MSLRVLVVDDSRVTRSTLVRMLQQLGCEIAGLGSDGVEAVDMYKRLRPDFMTLDLEMPNMGGQEALKLIRDYDPKAKIIIVSSVAMRTTVLECLKMGAIHYILKPFEPDKVSEVLQKSFPDFERREI
jgi:two-component system chemotaxis response regulator CheY